MWHAQTATQSLADAPITRHQWTVAAICGLIVFVDGFDAQAMGYVAPVLTTALRISRSVLGPVISSGLVGMMIGALVSGSIADRIGHAMPHPVPRSFWRNTRRLTPGRDHCSVDSRRHTRGAGYSGATRDADLGAVSILA